MNTGNKVTSYNLLYNKINPNTPKENAKVFPWLQIPAMCDDEVQHRRTFGS